MGRQENIEIFEDSQRMYESNPRLISAIKKSNEKQEFFAGDCQIMADAGRVYEKAARIIVSKKRTLEGCGGLCGKTGLHLKLCVSHKSWRRRNQRIIRSGRGHLPLLDALSESERTVGVE